MEEKQNKIKFVKIMNILLVFGLIFALYSQFQLLSIRAVNSDGLENANGAVFASSEVLPVGVPRIYGQKLGIKYDFVSSNNQQLADQTIEVLGNLDRTINLEGKNLERYVDIVSEISCEYCCGAKSIIVRKEDVAEMEKNIQNAITTGQITEEEAVKFRRTAGEAACGCAHSFAMRGLAKYLILNNGAEFTNEEILNELGKWKTLFFPEQMSAKAAVMKEKNIEFSYANLGSNRYRGIEQGATASGQMVGGC
ncbi:hypothetical protein J4449_01595 [Candidatus Woesearchaeota archaeon]|nr:hypothetical protein [Candidatus Woesearchaeota archaeon]